MNLALLFALIVSMIATGGSIFFSDVMGFYPCVMCWYQRVFMYPLVVLFFVALWRSDVRGVLPYSIPLTLIGWAFSIYHLLLYFGILPEQAAPCVEGVSCTVTYIQWFGFVTIPMLSFTSFFLLLLLQFYMIRGSREMK